MTNELEKNTSINTLIKQIGIFLLPIIATKLVDIFLITIPIWIQVFVLLACGVFAAYNFMLLPFENQRLTKIKAYINNLEFEKATEELNSKVLYKGKKARFKETRLWHTIHTMTGNLVEAYKATQKLFKLTMTDTEYRAALICRAITAFDAGNYRLMREIIEKFGTNTDKDIGEGLLAESLKAYTLKISGQPSEAKKMLRSALDTFGEGQDVVTAYINLAFYEDLEGNTLEAVHILKKAKIALEKRNDKLLISTLYHNLLLWLIKLGEIEPARSLLQEYERKINKKDKDQYLKFLNEKLIFARQISDASIIEDVYKIFRDQIKPYLSYEKALLLTVNLLRMESGNKEKTEDNLRSIQKRLDSIFALKFPNNWYAIKEIFYALKELEKDGVDHEWDNLYENLLQKTDELKNEIKDFRSHIPEAIVSMHYDWLLEELTLHKYSPRKESDYNGQFFTKLFSLADSMIMIATDAQNDLLKARACTLFCDDFSAFGSSMGKAAVDSFRGTARKHLHELERIVEAHPVENEFSEFSIACGRFSLLIEENTLKALAWYNEFEKRKVSALHYAPWLRGYLKELEAALSPMPPLAEVTVYTLNRLKITGFRRLLDFDLKIRSPMVMIGANGVGKTSVLDVFSLLASSASGKLAEKLSELGGFSSVLTREKATKSSFLVEMGVPNHMPLEYELKLSQQAMGYAIESETLTQLRPEQDKKGPFKHIDSKIGEIRFFYPKQERFVRPDWQYSIAETSLSQVPKMFKEPEALRHILGGTTLYHALDVGSRAPVKLPQQMKPATMPGLQGEDLAPFLYYLREENPDRYETIIDTLKSAFRDFETLNFPPVAAGMLTVTWKDRNFQKPLYLNELSEGTLRFLWLVSLLQSPVLPAVTMIDEPEVSLHPELLAILADVVRGAAKRTQLIIATHSDRLIRYMEPSEVAVMDISEDGFTQAAWADSLDLDAWLRDYSMDEVWRMGRMGGRS